MMKSTGSLFSRSLVCGGVNTASYVTATGSHFRCRKVSFHFLLWRLLQAKGTAAFCKAYCSSKEPNETASSEDSSQSGNIDKLPEPKWLPKDMQPHPWGDLEILDVRPVTQVLISCTKDPTCATNAASWQADDGTSFIGVPPSTKFSYQTVHPIDPPLRYAVDNNGYLADGVLVIPCEMENKWAVFYYNSKFIFIRRYSFFQQIFHFSHIKSSWLREVMAVVDSQITSDGNIELTKIQGRLTDAQEDSNLSPAVCQKSYLDFMMRTLVLKEESPAPLPPHITEMARAVPRTGGMWCWTQWGRDVHYATPLTESLLSRLPTPTHKLWSFSRLHVSAVRGNIEAAREELARGVSPGILADDGTPLHWATLAPGDTFKEIVDLLLSYKADINAKNWLGDTVVGMMVKPDDKNSIELEEELLARFERVRSRGADVNAKQGRGFTALHRAAEMAK